MKFHGVKDGSIVPDKYNNNAAVNTGLYREMMLQNVLTTLAAPLISYKHTDVVH